MELLVGKGSIYSDRPISPTVKNMGFGVTAVMLSYGETFRAYRRLMIKMLGDNGALSRFHTIINGETRKFLRRVLSDPSQLCAHIRK